MAGPVAVLDADVLVPILSCDLLLTAFDYDLYQPLVTPKILHEIVRNLLRAFPHLDPDALRRRVEQMRQALALHTREDTNDDDVLEGINRKDRHVVSAAIIHRADVVVTNDRRLRHEIVQFSGRLQAVTADEFTVGLSVADRDAIEHVIDELVTKRVRRSVTRVELLDRLAGTFPSFVARAGSD